MEKKLCRLVTVTHASLNIDTALSTRDSKSSYILYKQLHKVLETQPQTESVDVVQPSLKLE